MTTAGPCGGGKELQGRRLKTAARVTLLIVILLTGALALPGAASEPGSESESDVELEQAQPTPTLPDIEPTPIPTPTLSPAPTPTPTPTASPPSPKPGDGGGGGGTEGGGAGGGGGSGGGGSPAKKDGKKGSGSTSEAPEPFSWGFNRIAGSYSTDKLMAAAARLRSLGWSHQELIADLYPPFIIAGRANWVDTWGAPRVGPGALVRTHEGQDVFCKYGDPVLATQTGIIEFADGGLGGKVARLHRADGSYWYYAHLADFNERDFSTGDVVKRGDIIGFCGNTGNAVFTPPHVHFGWYGATGARDPMRHLIRWLRQAERKAARLVVRAEGDRVSEIPTLTAARRFGDAFAPDLSEFSVAGGAPWASGSVPVGGAFGLAQVALQEALEGEGIAGDDAFVTSHFESGSDVGVTRPTGGRRQPRARPAPGPEFAD